MIRSYFDDNSADSVIITALPLERDAVLAKLQDIELIEIKGRSYHKSFIAKENGEYGKVVVLCLFAMGNTSSALATAQAINVWNPHNLFLTGITGGLKGTGVKLGDVVIASQIVGYDIGKIFESHYEPRYESLPSSYRLLQAAHELPLLQWQRELKVIPPIKVKRKSKAHFGVVGSGDKVVASEDFIEQFRGHWSKMVAVEMEGFGFTAAAYQAATVPGSILIKGISDWADSKKDDRWRNYAADAAASYTVSLIKSIFGLGRKSPPVLKQPSGGFTGRNKIKLCGRLGDDWEDLADYFDIPENHLRRFKPGRECQRIWEWLRQRKKLDGLKDALEFIDREDLLDTLEPI